MAKSEVSRGVGADCEAEAHSLETIEAGELACECGSAGCRAKVALSAPTLGWARSRGLSVLYPGHEASDDVVADRTERFVLVRARQ